MDTIDAHLEEGAVAWTNYRGDQFIRHPCSGFADFLYSNRTLKYPVSVDFYLETTSSNVAEGAAADCKGCTLIHDAVTTFRQDRLPMNECLLELASDNEFTNSSYPKIPLYLKSIDETARKQGAGGTKEPVLASYADENLVRKYLEKGLKVQLDWSRDLRPDGDLFFISILASQSHANSVDCTSSSQTTQRLNHWLVECTETHPGCQNFSETALPKRVLEIHDAYVYLRENSIEKSRYACLSHCWGAQGPSFRLEESTYQQLTNGVPVDQLPKTFGDAVSICISIKIRFLWIDALCIKQDDADDWVEAAATMGDIYENMWITIAATGSGSSQRGIYSALPNRYKARALHNPDFQVREELPFFGQSARPIQDHDSWPLLRRAWAYQERQLSPRMVDFGQQQIFWACDSKFASQDGQYPSRFVSREKKDLLQWERIVEEYSALQLTYESDRLPAIAAIVLRVMRIRPHDTYIAGLWKDTLIQGLCWNVTGFQARPRRSDRIPTWSWASASGPIRYYFRGMSLRNVVQLEDVTFTSVGALHMGKVKDAIITLRGPACHLPDSAYRVLREGISATSSTYLPLTSSLGCCAWIDFNWEAVKPPIWSAYNLVFLFLSRELHKSESKGQVYYGIVLKAVEHDVFERVGFGLVCLDHSIYGHISSEKVSDGIINNEGIGDRERIEEDNEEGGDEEGDDEEGADEKRVDKKGDDEKGDDKHTAHKGSVNFYATKPHIRTAKVETDHVDIEDEMGRGDDAMCYCISALPRQTFRII